MKNLIVGQSGGPSVAINATLAGVVYAAQKSEKIGKVYGSKNGVEGILNDNVIDLSDFSEFEKLKVTPAMALGSCRCKLPDDFNSPIYGKIDAFIKKYDIGFITYIGGNDSMDTVSKLSRYYEGRENAPLVLGLPKTIDNDLPETDHTPGYGSAAKYLAVTVNELIRDVSIYNLKSVTIIEIMGRDAGWLTLAGGLPKFLGGEKPDIVAIPEVPFDEKKFIEKIKEKMQFTNNIVVAVSEGIRDKDGNYVGSATKSGAVDIFGHAYLSGVGKYLEHLVKNEIGCKVRSIELNLMQRCSSHIASLSDIEESFEVGKFGVKAILNGENGKMVTINRVSNDPYKSDFSTVSVEYAANKDKPVPEKWYNLEDKQVQKEICEYILPLIKGDTKKFENEFGIYDYVIF